MNFKILPEIYIIERANLSIVNNMINKKRDDIVHKIEKFLSKNGGMTITDFVNKLNISKSAIRTSLAKLDDAEKVSIKKIGMAKVYTLKK